MDEFIYVVTFITVAVALVVTGGILLLPCIAYITPHFRYDIAWISLDSLITAIKTERYDGHPNMADAQLLNRRQGLLTRLEKYIETGAADDSVQIRDFAVLTLLAQPRTDISIGEDFLLRFRRLHFQTLSYERFAQRMDSSRGIRRTRIRRALWYAKELAFLARMSSTHYSGRVLSRVIRTAGEYVTSGTVIGLIGAVCYWYGGNTADKYVDNVAYGITIGAIGGYDYFCVNALTPVVRQLRQLSPRGSEPNTPWRVRDKIAVAAILCFFVYMILQFRYHYSEQFLAWLQRKISQHHFHIHVPPNIVAELFLTGMAAVILIAGYRYARNSIQREKALAWRFYDAGWACLALLFGALLLQVDLDSILYRAGDARPVPVWESYLLEVSLCGGMVLLAAGRITEVVQRRRIFKRELGRPPRWQLGIWLSICATWVGAFLAIGAAGTVGTMWQRTNSPESEIGPTPLWWFITAAVITGLAIIVTIVLLIIRYGRLTKDALDLATARHARATADNVREGTELPVATLDED